MSKQHSDIDYERIAKYLAGESDEREASVVEDWINYSEGNKGLFNQMKALWQNTGFVMPHENADVDIDKGWEKLKGKYKPVQKNEPNVMARDKKGKGIRFYFYRVAAVILIGLLVYAIYPKLVRQQPQNLVVKDETLLANDSLLADTLADGSSIILNANTQLSFSPEFNKAERVVSLKGEAFFEVAENAAKPFVIQMTSAEITVVGTAFYVKAYDSLNTIEVVVVEGIVRVSTASMEVDLAQGESLVVDKATGKSTKNEEYDPNSMYWQTKTLIFQNDDLEDVFEALRKYYHVDIVAENGQILNCRFTAKLSGESIEDILQIMESSFDLTYQHDGSTIVISGSGCN